MFQLLASFTNRFGSMICEEAKIEAPAAVDVYPMVSPGAIWIEFCKQHVMSDVVPAGTTGFAPVLISYLVPLWIMYPPSVTEP
jgi:hypothetical protein